MSEFKFQSPGVSLKEGGEQVQILFEYEPAILWAIKEAFREMEEKKWEYVYYYFDIHRTILLPDYNNTTTDFYPHAKEVLQYLSKRKDIKMSLFTCSYPHEIERYQRFFKENEINFVYENKNPEVGNTKYGYYQDKPYFNVLFEDKAGFRADRDWIVLKHYFNIP